MTNLPRERASHIDGTSVEPSDTVCLGPRVRFALYGSRLWVVVTNRASNKDRVTTALLRWTAKATRILAKRRAVRTACATRRDPFVLLSEKLAANRTSGSPRSSTHMGLT